MVLRKLKDALANNKTKSEQRESRLLGFQTIDELRKFKEDVKNEARLKAAEINKKRMKDKLQKKIVYRRTHTPLEQMADMGLKVKKGINQLQNGLDEFDKAMNPKPKKSGPGRKKSKKKSDMWGIKF